jgi:hypothetical protein
VSGEGEEVKRQNHGQDSFLPQVRDPAGRKEAKEVTEVEEDTEVTEAKK